MQALAASSCAHEILGDSTATRRLRDEIARAALYSSNVLITGPSGTGKELVARQVHALGARSRQPFIPVDCASMSGELMASQLFGHTAGAFTGAHCETLGCFRAANRGTLFLDEIGELDFSLQSKLLRVLQERSVTPVGGHQCEAIDVRIVAATNRELHAEVLAGRFREDLYYRLNVAHLRTTPLRARREDIPPLAAEFLRQLADEGLPRCSLSSDALDLLSRFDWPGNVRQLRNVLELGAIKCPSNVITANLIKPILFLASEVTEVESEEKNNLEFVAATLATAYEIPQPAAGRLTTRPNTVWPSLASLERDHIVRTLEHTFYNRSAAARLLGVTRQSLLRKMKQYDVEAPAR